MAIRKDKGGLQTISIAGNNRDFQTITIAGDFIEYRGTNKEYVSGPGVDVVTSENEKFYLEPGRGYKANAPFRWVNIYANNPFHLGTRLYWFQIGFGKTSSASSGGVSLFRKGYLEGEHAPASTMNERSLLTAGSIQYNGLITLGTATPIITVDFPGESFATPKMVSAVPIVSFDVRISAVGVFSGSIKVTGNNFSLPSQFAIPVKDAQLNTILGGIILPANLIPITDPTIPAFWLGNMFHALTFGFSGLTFEFVNPPGTCTAAIDVYFNHVHGLPIRFN
jgi:hypothetical protein